MDLYNTHKSTIALCNTHNACTHWLTMYSLKAEAYASTKGIKVHHSFEQYSQCLHSLTHHVLTEGSSTYTHKRNKSTIKLFVQYSQCLHPLTHHVLTEGSSICIHKRNQVLHGFVQGWDQASHLGVQVIELTVAICHKTNHGTQGCTLQKNTATTHTHTCTHTHTHTHAYTHTTSSGTCHNQNLYVSFEPCSLLNTCCFELWYTCLLPHPVPSKYFGGVTAVEITGSLFGVCMITTMPIYTKKTYNFTVTLQVQHSLGSAAASL